MDNINGIAGNHQTNLKIKIIDFVIITDKIDCMTLAEGIQSYQYITKTPRIHK